MGKISDSSSNVYLKSSAKSLDLLKQILYSGKEESKNNVDELRFIVSNRILPLLAEANIEDECEKAVALRKINSKLLISSTFNTIKEKTILGIGGRFSAGKSCFINSLIDSDNPLLPEGQLPTTSIATYIINGSVRNNIITNLHGEDIKLDNKAVVALNHQFFEKWFGNDYVVDFAKYVNLFVISSPDFGFKNLAILDTPGYNKYDGRKKTDASDNEKARTELQSVDYLIWLIDVENGVIKDEDLNFLENNINLNTEILFVINKSDKKTNSALNSIIEETKAAIEDHGFLNYIDVVGYSSFYGKEFRQDLFVDDNSDAYVDKKEGVIWNFLNEINEHSFERPDFISEIRNICENMNEQLKSQYEDYGHIEEQYRDMVLENNDVINLKSVIELYRNAVAEKMKIGRMMSSLSKILIDIKAFDS